MGLPFPRVRPHPQPCTLFVMGGVAVRVWAPPRGRVAGKRRGTLHHTPATRPSSLSAGDGRPSSSAGSSLGPTAWVHTVKAYAHLPQFLFSSQVFIPSKSTPSLICSPNALPEPAGDEEI